MIKIKLERGDQIERQEADWIRTHISPYEEIWGRYIGNDGSNNALELVTGSSEFISHRDKFNQCHYSILISLLILRQESERYQENLGIATTPQSYLDIVRDLTGFMAQVGRLRDLFEAISNCLGMGKSLWERFDDFYKSRSTVIHGSVVPMKIEEGFVWVPNFEHLSS